MYRVEQVVPEIIKRRRKVKSFLFKRGDIFK